MLWSSLFFLTHVITFSNSGTKVHSVSQILLLHALSLWWYTQEGNIRQLSEACEVRQLLASRKKMMPVGAAHIRHASATFSEWRSNGSNLFFFSMSQCSQTRHATQHTEKLLGSMLRVSTIFYDLCHLWSHSKTRLQKEVLFWKTNTKIICCCSR